MRSLNVWKAFVWGRSKYILAVEIQKRVYISIFSILLIVMQLLSAIYFVFLAAQLFLSVYYTRTLLFLLYNLFIFKLSFPELRQCYEWLIEVASSEKIYKN